MTFENYNLIFQTFGCSRRLHSLMYFLFCCNFTAFIQFLYFNAACMSDMCYYLLTYLLTYTISYVVTKFLVNAGSKMPIVDNDIDTALCST